MQTIRIKESFNDVVGQVGFTYKITPLDKKAITSFADNVLVD